MSSEITVSVIVPTRNRASYLNDCLESLARQDFDGQFEVIVVDNGSTDASPRILEQWCRSDPRFRMTREDRIGLSLAKNAGIRLARGDLLLFTDDDVIVDHRWIDMYARFFASQDGELVVAGGRIVPVPDDLADWPTWVTDPVLDDLGRLDYQHEGPVSEAWEYVWGANMAFSAFTVKRIGLWNERLGRRGDKRGTFEDTEYQDRVRAVGAPVWFCPDAVVHHRVPRRGVTPCRVLMTTFARGGNAYWQERLRSTSPPRPPTRPAGRSISALVVHLAAWPLWTAVFRLTSTDWTFHRARRAAWSSGWVMARLRDGRTSKLASRAIGRSASVARRAALRLAPGSVAEAEEILGLRPSR